MSDKTNNETNKFEKASESVGKSLTIGVKKAGEGAKVVGTFSAKVSKGFWAGCKAFGKGCKNEWSNDSK